MQFRIRPISSAHLLAVTNICEAQIRLDNAYVAKLLLCILSLDRWGNNDVLANLPVDRCGNASAVPSLQAIDNAQDLGGVSAGAGGVAHAEPDFLLRVNDEDGTDGECDALLVDICEILVVDHIVEP